jgi:hypothetical protein
MAGSPVAGWPVALWHELWLRLVRARKRRDIPVSGSAGGPMCYEYR